MLQGGKRAIARPTRALAMLLRRPASLPRIRVVCVREQSGGPVLAAASRDKSADNRRRRLVFLVAYDGAHLSGSQLVSGGPVDTTVDGFIVKALEKLALIRSYAFNEPGQLSWDRAARTGPGEHAVGNVLTMMVRLPFDEVVCRTLHLPFLRRRINKLLPAAVRVLSVAQARDQFSAVDNVSSRAYHYWLPLDALLPPGTARDVDPSSAAARDALARFRATLREFVGTHSFHNFTLPESRASFVAPPKPSDAQTDADTDAGLRRAWKRAHSAAAPCALPDVLEAISSPGGAAPASLQAFRSSSGGAGPRTPFGVLLESLHKGGDAPSAGWSLSPQVSRTILHAEASEPIPVTAAGGGGDAGMTWRQLRLGRPSQDPLDHGFEYPGVPIGGLWEVPPLAPVSPPGQGTVEAGEDGGLPRVVVGHVVRVLLHANGLMDRQASTMIGTALAVQRRLLDIGVLRAALELPACPPLPQAPPGGLVMAEAHPTEASFMTWRHPAGTADDAIPETTTPRRHAHMDDPRHVDPAAAAAQSPDVALLRADAAVARRAFFEATLAPRLLAFCGFGGAAAAASPPSSPPWTYSADADRALAAHPPSAAAALTFPAWAEQVLPAMTMDGPLQAAVAEALKATEEAASARCCEAAASELRACEAAAAALWAKEGRALPALSVPLVEGQRARKSSEEMHRRREAVRAAAVTGLAWATLQEVRRSVLPARLARALCARLRLPRQRDAHDIARAIAYRVLSEEWPPVATAEQHAEWAAGVGALLLLREGQLATLLERAQDRRAVLVKVEKRARAAPEVIRG